MNNSYLQLESLKIAKIFLNICKQKSLKAFAFGNTFKDAVLEGKLSQTATNVKFAMPRADFDRFVDEAELPENYQIESYKNNLESLRFYARINKIDSSVEYEFMNLKAQNCPNISIYPLDTISEENAYALMIMASETIYDFRKAVQSDLMKHTMEFTSTDYDAYLQILKDNYDNVINESINCNGDMYTIFCLNDNKNGNYLKLSKSFYEDSTNIELQGIKVPVPSNYETALNEMYNGNFLIYEDAQPISYYRTMPWNTYRDEFVDYGYCDVPLSINLSDDFYATENRGESQYMVTTPYKELWAIQLDLLSQLKTICEDNNIKYFADGGTLLGAVRHNGFIPWDDDVDIIMPREDYDRFLKIAPNSLDKRYQIIKGGKGRFSKLCNVNTTYVTESKSVFFTNLKGITIDIFPMDDIPNNDETFDTMLTDISINSITNYSKVLPKYLSEDDTNRGCILALSSANGKKFTRTKSLYEQTTQLPFEGIMINVPLQYTDACIEQYGDDYMTEIYGGSNHNVIDFSTKIPFEAYKRSHINHNCSNQLL